MPNTLTEVSFGAFLFTSRFGDMSDAAVLDQTLAVADTAASAGFDSLWASEHHFIRYGLNPNALTLAGYLAGRTGLPVGTAVTLLPQHNPVRVAEEAALLDHLTRGGFTLGVGRGGPVVDYEVFAGGLAHYHDGLDEALDLLLRSWQGEVSAASDLYRFRPVQPLPKPRSAGGPRLMMAATSDTGVERAARLGAPMLFFFHQDDATKAGLVARHAELAAGHGHPDGPHRHAAALVVEVADSDDEAAALIRGPVKEFLVAASNEYTAIDGAELPRRDEAFLDAFTEHVLATHPVGGPATVIERLVRTVEESGCRELLLKVENGPDTERAVANVARLGAEVLPEVRAALRPVSAASSRS